MRAAVALLLLALLALGTAAEAAVVIPLLDEDLVAGADVIVLGRVTRITSHADLFGDVSTYITLGIDEVLKGALSGPEITIRELGGTVGDRNAWISANPQFVVGEPVLVFMDQRDDGTLRTYQLYLGKFTVVTDPASGDRVAVRAVPSQVTELGSLAGPIVRVPVGDIARGLDDFGRFIRAHAFDPAPPTTRPRPRLPFQSASIPPSGLVEELYEFRFIADPNPPTAVNPNQFTPRWSWADTNTPMTMRIFSNGEPAAPTLGFEQIRAAFKAWGRVPTASFRFAEGAPISGTGGYVTDGVSTISFRDPRGQISNPSGCTGVLAVTWVPWTTSSATTVNGRTFGGILEADMVLADGWAGCGFYESFNNFTEVVTHELGHALGLGHSADTSATMYAYIHFDGRAATLQADDRAGVTYLYPARTLTIQIVGDGAVTSSLDGIACPGQCAAGFAPGTTIGLTGIAGPGSTFIGFSGLGCGTSVAMDADRTCVATFVTGPPTLFGDVSASNPYLGWIEALAKAGITSGCSMSPPLFCPDGGVSRAEMAVFLLRGTHGAGYQPPAASGMFADVSVGYSFATWIEQLARDGITTGCATSPPLYCPDTGVTRAQMAVFLLRAKHGASYDPPLPTGLFADVPVSHPYAKWIEQLAREGITSGCSANAYCPDAPVTRGQMAVFLVRAFNLPL